LVGVILVSFGSLRLWQDSATSQERMNTTRHLRTVLKPAIDAARAALRRIDDDDVPARLRPVARHGDGRLPVPLVKALLRGLEEDEWFRGKALDAFERSGSGDPVSLAYLEQAPGWWIAVVEAVAIAEGAEAADRLRHLEREIDTLRERARADRARLKAMRQERDAATAASQASIDDRLEPLRAAATAARAERNRTLEEVASLRSALDRATAERLEAERAAAMLSEAVRGARRTAAQLRRSVESGRSESIPKQPMDVARWLDRVAATLTPYREAVAEKVDAELGADDVQAMVPFGIAPDSGEAIEALAGLSRRTVLVDGHNLLGVLDASTMATGRARRQLTASLGKLMRHLGDSTIEVVFDSDLEEGRPKAVTSTGIVVRFAPGELIADDVIVGRVESLRSGAVVISDDREVRERCARLGATVLWARALADWL
jgi:predicted RNA-binding protein with PIN domain